MRKIITISREFGSGGRELGKRLAGLLQVAYYDRRIVIEIAEKAHMDEAYVETALNRRLTVAYPYNFRSAFSEITSMNNETTALLAEQHNILKKVAEKEDCVIIGRGASTVLGDYNPLKIFVYADMPAKIERCRQRADEDENLTDKEMERKIKQIDKSRAATYDIFSEYSWGDKRAYNLCINSTDMDIKDMVPVIAEYANFYFSSRNSK